MTFDLTAKDLAISITLGVILFAVIMVFILVATGDSPVTAEEPDEHHIIDVIEKVHHPEYLYTYVLEDDNGNRYLYVDGGLILMPSPKKEE